MDRNQEMLAYYFGQLHSEWAQKKALAYLRILAEAEGNEKGRESREREKRTGISPHGAHDQRMTE
ncbi:MAG: hypothetical protein IKH30_07725 [Clostridia bacterium]|nr:hypothetical protein [Clostridia bacterium]